MTTDDTTRSAASRWGRALATGAAALSLLALAACSGDAAPGETGEAGADGERATIRLIVGPVFYEPVRIAEAEGILDEYDLDVEVMDGNTASENAAQLVAGQADIAMSGGVSVIQGAVEGLGIRAILGATSSDPEATAGLLAAADGGIESCADLEGKTVGLQGLNETTHLGTMLCAEEAGIDPSTITFVQLPLPNLNDAVQSGEVDAAYNIGAFYGDGLDQGLVAAGLPSTQDVLAYGPSVVYAATDDYVEENPDVVERFQQAMTDAHERGRADDFAMIRDVQREYSQLDPDYITNQILAGYQTDLYESGLQRTLDGMFEYGFISREVAIDEVVSPVAPLAP
ncbi:MAG: ABC transporter substrate-binding protein [Pseudoclavibacter sp.]